MVSPVLYQEMLLGGRRNRQYVFRWIYAGLLVFELGLYALVYLVFANTGGMRLPTYTTFATFSQAFVGFLVGQHFLLLLLVTPTVTAGAITDEKSRGTLVYLLTADLRPGEIILGKMLGRTYQVVLLSLTALPLLCLFGVYAGLDLLRLGAFVAATLLLVYALAAASLLASVLCRHTRDAVLSLYALAFAAYVVALVVRVVLEGWRTPASAGPAWLRGLAGFLELFNPLAPLGDNWLDAAPGDLVQRLWVLLLCWGLFGCGCLVLAVLLLRRSYLRYLQGAERKKERWWRARRAPVGNNPLAWKERHVEGVAPLAILRGLPMWLGLVLVFAVTTVWAGYLLLRNMPGETVNSLAARVSRGDWEGLVGVVRAMPPGGASRDFYYAFGLPVMLIAGLIIGIRCSGAVTGEREKQTWEALLLTPMETRQLIRGKFWGIIGATWPYLIAYAVPALLLSAVGGAGAFFWTLLWLGVTLLAMAYVGAAGLWCSVRSKGSWRSLLGTLAFAYGGGSLLLCVGSPVVVALWFILAFALVLFDSMTGTTGVAVAFARGWDAFNISVCVTLAGIFVLVAWRLLVSAEYRVGILERTKHWKNEPRRYRSDRPIPVVRRARRYEDDDDRY